ncbi:MFS transporter [Cupriavidus sp. WKF15]|uniref:MFS transporter n=1 Tax=Cupriavidus sp. WKF15 TaxID=3032282 RepID=UPI0023E1D0D6|nr:MFS transporter [Cupriavidus sp. WKF15]WER50872.1 MFS transporter [Cupriavidus sp. WKF15]
MSPNAGIQPQKIASIAAASPNRKCEAARSHLLYVLSLTSEKTRNVNKGCCRTCEVPIGHINRQYNLEEGGGVSTNIRKLIDESPMSRLQTVAVIVCIILNMLDGFDVLAMAFTAPHLAAGWGLSGKELGLLFSAGLVGIGVGSVLIAPIGDRIGRRKVILCCLCMIGSGMLASSVTQGVLQLAAARAYTGLGIGGMVPSITVIAGEYASNKWRSASISFQATGYAVGATAGGAMAAYLMSIWGWRSVFAFGGVATLLSIPMVLAVLPESLDYLLTKRPARALRTINRTLVRMKRPPIDTLPEVTNVAAAAEPSRGLAALMKAPLLHRTLALWAAFFFVLGSFYFVASWTPKLLVQAGMSAEQGVTGGVLLNLGGIVGSALFSLLSARFGLRPLLIASLVAGGVLMFAFGTQTTSLGVVMAISILLGAVLTSSVAGMYALSLAIYPTGIRTTGVGFAAGAGRIGAVVSPLVVGALLDGGWSVPNLYFAFVLPVAGAAIAVAIAHVSVPDSRDGREPAVS